MPAARGVTHSSRGAPRETVAEFVQITLPPRLTMRCTVEIFDSDTRTPPRALVGSVFVSSAIAGGVVRSASKRCAVVQ